jgi:hypothetical protein
MPRCLPEGKALIVEARDESGALVGVSGRAEYPAEIAQLTGTAELVEEVVVHTLSSSKLNVTWERSVASNGTAEQALAPFPCFYGGQLHASLWFRPLLSSSVNGLTHPFVHDFDSEKHPRLPIFTTVCFRRRL